MERRNAPQVTKPASFGVRKTGYDALIKPHMSQWQKETMSDLHPMEHHGDRLPHEGFTAGEEVFWLAIAFVVVLPLIVYAYWSFQA